MARRKIGHRYGGVHKQVRRHFALEMQRGVVFACWRCGEESPHEAAAGRRGGEGAWLAWPRSTRSRFWKYDGERVEIDVEIVALIKAIWWHGLETDLSCQSQDGRVWVEMPGRDAERLLRLLALRDPELRATILRLVPGEHADPCDFYEYQAAHGWQYRVSAESYPVGLWLSVGIRFPRDQLTAVVAALERAQDVA